jgi:hypothetical protein
VGGQQGLQGVFSQALVPPSCLPAPFKTLLRPLIPHAILLRLPLTSCSLLLPSAHSYVAQALCTEASLASLRRHYPQIYDADEKLVVEPSRVRVQRRDFLSAFQTITPASHRSAAANAR